MPALHSRHRRHRQSKVGCFASLLTTAILATLVITAITLHRWTLALALVSAVAVLLAIVLGQAARR